MKEKLAIDKTNWILVKFGDVAFEPKENAKDIHNEGIEHVVGLEHIDTENIHLTRSGVLEETTTFSKKFRKGDVLFGRRRAYLKKAALASFDGICSGDITVFRAKDNLLPELLPFIVNNEKFFDYAVKHSAGGLSPRVKFKDLANYEFLLPPKDQQAQLAELLWAMDEVVQHIDWQIFSLNNSMKSCLKEWLWKGIHHSALVESAIGLIPSNWTVAKFESVLQKFKSGLSRRIVSQDIGIPVLISGNIQKGRLVTSELKYWYTKDPQGANIANYILKEGDILLCFINSISQIGKCCLFEDMGRDAIYTTNLFRIVPKSEINNVFLYYLMSSAYIQNKIKQITMPAVNQASFTKTDFLRIKFALPPLNEQIEIATKLKQLDTTIDVCKQELTNSKALQKSLINQVFG